MKQPVALFLVPTPIGNLKDFTFRAVDVLQAVDVILAEDTRTSGILLKHYQIAKPLKSFHIFNEHKVLAGIIGQMKDGKSFALLSDAGTPGISDPGYLLVRECLRAELTVSCLPGPTAVIPALVNSGFPTDRFVFEGFLPHKKGRQTRLHELSEETRTIVLYESPHRLLKTLEQMLPEFGADRPVSVARELTKLHEETITGTLQDVIGHFTRVEAKGEIVLVVHGKVA